MSKKESGTKSRAQGAHIHVSLNRDGTRTVEVEVDYKFAYELSLAARYMATQASKLPEGYENHLAIRANVIGSIVLSYSSLEAAWNEVLRLYVHDKESSLDESQRRVFEVIDEEDLRPQNARNTLQLFNLCLRIIDKPEMRVGENPFQAANLVRELRNMLVHPDPGRVITQSADPSFNYAEQQRIVKSLRSQLNLSKKATFPDQVLVKECAAWAVKSTQEFLHEFAVRSGIRFSFITDPKT